MAQDHPRPGPPEERHDRQEHHQGRHVRRGCAGRLRGHARTRPLQQPLHGLRQDHFGDPRPLLGSAGQDLYRFRRPLRHGEPGPGSRGAGDRPVDRLRLQSPQRSQDAHPLHQPVGAAQLLVDPAWRAGRAEPVGVAVPRAQGPGRAGIRRQPDPRRSPPRHRLRQIHQGPLGPAGRVRPGAQDPAGRDHRRARGLQENHRHADVGGRPGHGGLRHLLHQDQ